MPGIQILIKLQGLVVIEAKYFISIDITTTVEPLLTNPLN